MLGDSQVIGGLCAAAFAAGVSTLGLLTMAVLGDWGRRNSAYFSAFAVGFLLVAVFFHLIPEALAKSMTAWRWVVVGALVLGALGLTLRFSARRRVGSGDLAFGYASIFALGSHSVLDGVFYVTSFQEQVFTGGLATFGLLLHEFPEGVIAYFLLREAGLGRIASGLWAFVAASVTTIAGAIIAAFAFQRFGTPDLSTLMGLTAGGLIYIIFLHLAPHASLTPKRRGYAVASLGVAVALAAIIFRDVTGH